MADKVLKDLEAEITASTKMLGSLSQQIENINVSINKTLAGLQAEYKKTKRQEIDDLEVQENALESQYLDLRKKLFEAKHKWRVTLANILEAESKVIIKYKLK
jgi:tRNA(Glu) U13 pseudouridine synthase TruD